MFERFNQRSRRVIVLAQEEARLLNHNYIGTEHLLLGLLAEDGRAARVLESVDISLQPARDQVREVIGEGSQMPTGHIPFTPRAKKVLELSLREALTLRSQSISSVHLLLGLIAEGQGAGARIIERLGVPLSTVRERAVEQAGPEPDPTPAYGAEAGLLRTALRMEGPALTAALTSINRRLTRIEKHLGITADPEEDDSGPAVASDPESSEGPDPEGGPTAVAE